MKIELNDTVNFLCDGKKQKFTVIEIDTYFCILQCPKTKKTEGLIPLNELRIAMPDLKYITLQANEITRLNDKIKELEGNIVDMSEKIEELGGDIENSEYDIDVLHSKIIDNCETNLDKINKGYELINNECYY